MVWITEAILIRNMHPFTRTMFQLVDATCMDDNMEALADQVDVIFTATPQGLCASLVNEEILIQSKDHRSECGFPYQRCKSI